MTFRIRMFMGANVLENGWYIGLPYLLVGLFLSLFTKRLLWRRYYQLTGYAIIGPLNGLFVWEVLTQNATINQIYYTGILLGLISVGGSLFGYHYWVSKTGKIAYGVMGRLNSRIGILDPNLAPLNREESVNQFIDGQLAWFRLTPLIVGLSMFAVRLSSFDVAHIVFTLWGIIFLNASLMRTGQLIHFIGSIRYWEDKNSKTMKLRR